MTVVARPRERVTAEASAENTGEVNLMSAGEPEEVEAYQAIFDDLINSEADYTAEVESVGDFEEEFQIRSEGGTLDLAAAPSPERSPASSSRVATSPRGPAGLSTR